MKHASRAGIFAIGVLLLAESSTLASGSLLVSWNPNSEADLAGYKVYYGTQPGYYTRIVDVGSVTSHQVDQLTEGVEYYFALTAYDSSGNESLFSQEVNAALPDNSPPVLLSVVAYDSVTLVLKFDEPLEEPSAQAAANYSVTGGITVSSAALQTDQRTVHLTTSLNTPDHTYTLTVSGIADLAVPANVMSTPTSMDYVFTRELNVQIAKPANYQASTLSEGSMYYVDRDYVVAAIPDELSDARWIRTGNDDKNSTAAEFLEFDVSTHAEVWVAYDPRAITLPSWLEADFERSNLKLAVSDEVGQLQFWKRTIQPGAVLLGGNKAGGGSGAKSMYVVAITGVSGSSEGPSDPVVANAPDDIILSVGGDAYQRDLNAAPRVFNNPVSGGLTYSASSSGEHIATANMVNDHEIKVTPVAAGACFITLTARNTQGGTASTNFMVRVAVDQTPVVLNRIDDLILAVDGTSYSRDLTESPRVFDSPVGSAMTYFANCSDEGVAIAQVSNGKHLVVTPVAAGNATVFVTAESNAGGSASTTFQVTVTELQGPAVINQISDVTLELSGDPFIRDLEAAPRVFDGPTGVQLTYRASTTDQSVATANISEGKILKVSAEAKGTATISITAEDSRGSSAIATFSVRVVEANQPDDPGGPSDPGENPNEPDDPGDPGPPGPSEGGPPPTEFVLHHNYPNPFTPETQLRFDLPGEFDVKLRIYNMIGQQVKEIDLGILAAGRYAQTWDATDDGGNLLPSGQYFCKVTLSHSLNLTADSEMKVVAYSLVQKMTLVR